MNYVKNLVKILLLAQCLLLFCACNKKKATTVETIVEPTEQNIMNLADFVKCPFTEEFDDKTNLEKYVLKKFGRPDEILKGRGPLNDTNNADIIIDQITLRYYVKYPIEKFSSFTICRGVSKKFEAFDNIYIQHFIDLKYEINEKTTIRDIENLFGKPKRVDEGSRTVKRPYSFTDYHYFYSNDDRSYQYLLDFGFREERLYSIDIRTHIYFW